MNKVVLLGRLCGDPEVRYTQGDKPMAVARFRLAVNRRFKKENEQSADFINCVAFGKNAEFDEKYFKKGMQVCISGRIQTGNYTNKDGVKVYTTDIIVEEQDFAESKKDSESSNTPAQEQQNSSNNGWVNIPDGIDEELPFS